MDDLPEFTVERLQWEDEALGAIDLPKARLTFRRSFGSGLSRRASDPPGEVWAVGDRGPNLKIETLLDRYGADHLAHLSAVPGAKVMPRLDIGPSIARLKVEGGRLDLIASFPIRDAAGSPVSGLPIPGGAHAASEPALDLGGATIPPDPSGLDTEGIASLTDGSILVSDEFGPSLVRLDAKGRVLGRYVPQGTRLDADYPVHDTLPAIASTRQLNRGFEAIAASEDDRWLFVAFQSPLAHPDKEAHRRARHVRLWRIDAARMEAVDQWLYPLDPPESFARDAAKGAVEWSDLKLSELVALPGERLLVLERASETTKIYRISPMEEHRLPTDHFRRGTRPTAEQLSEEGHELPSLVKTLLFSSDHAPEISRDLEGMAVLSPHELLLVNDNDFGVEGARTCFWKIVFDEPVLA